MDERTTKLDTHFVKTNDFRTVYGSGFYGGITASGQLSMIVYTERVPVPKRITYQIDFPVSTTAEEIEREGKEGMVREAQFGVILDVNTAKSLIQWLQRKLEEHKQAEEAAKK